MTDEQHNESEATGLDFCRTIMEKLVSEWDDMVRRPTNHMHMMEDIERVHGFSGAMNMNQGNIFDSL